MRRRGTSKMVISRRNVLRAIGGSSLLLPFVPILGARADNGGTPKRLVIVFSSNGTVHEQWKPTMNGSGLVLSTILEPLEEFKSQLLVVDGLRYEAAEVRPPSVQDGHYGGMNTALTGSIPTFPKQRFEDRSLATSISVDQHIAATLSKGLREKSLLTGIQVDQGNTTTAALSYSGSMAPILAEQDPHQVYETLFKDFVKPGASAPDPAIEARIQDERSVLDFVYKDLGRLRGQMASEERQKLDAHLNSIEEIEAALGRGAGSGALDSCDRPDIGNRLNPELNEHIPRISRRQIDLVTMALACDFTRVATIQYGRAGAQHRFTWLGSEFNTDESLSMFDGTKGIHGLAHDEDHGPSREKLTRCHRWYAGEVAYLLGRLRDIPEGNGTMLDNTLVVWMNEMGTGSHGLRNTPWVLAGNVGGHFRTGRVVTAQGQPHNRLLLSLCHAMGLNDDWFGHRDLGREPLPDLT